MTRDDRGDSVHVMAEWIRDARTGRYGVVVACRDATRGARRWKKEREPDSRSSGGVRIAGVRTLAMVEAPELVAEESAAVV